MFAPTFTCHHHPHYKAVHQPKPGCVLCHAMWQERIVYLEQQEWDDYEEDGPMDLEDQLDAALDRCSLGKPEGGL